MFTEPSPPWMVPALVPAGGPLEQQVAPFPHFTRAVGSFCRNAEGRANSG